MSVAEQLRHASSVRDRLRNPPNAVEDMGIDLKREKFQVVPIRQPEPVVEVVEITAPAETTEQLIARQVRELNEQLERLTRQKEEIEHRRIPSVELIQKAVCAYYGISLMDMLSCRRTKILVRPRHIAMYLAKEMTTQSLPQIGRRFGGRDHTTCLHAIRSIKSLRVTDPQVDGVVREIQARFAPV